MHEKRDDLEIWEEKTNIRENKRKWQRKTEWCKKVVRKEARYIWKWRCAFKSTATDRYDVDIDLC